jgi:hypothetical protein
LLKGPVGNFIERYMTPDSLVFQHGLVDRGHWLALLRRFRSRQLRRSLVGARELWAPWGLEVWMRRWSQWICHGASLVILWP